MKIGIMLENKKVQILDEVKEITWDNYHNNLVVIMNDGKTFNGFELSAVVAFTIRD